MVVKVALPHVHTQYTYILRSLLYLSLSVAITTPAAVSFVPFLNAFDLTHHYAVG